MITRYDTKALLFLATFVIFSLGYFGDTKTLLLLVLVPTLFIYCKGNIEIPRVAIILFLLYSINSTFIYLFCFSDLQYTRYLVQLCKLLLVFGSFLIGYNLTTYMSISKLRLILTVTIYLAIAIGFLQFALYSLNLPYWNLSLNRNFSAIDSYLGFRPSGLLGEPKYLSVFIAMALFINFKASGFKKAHNVLLSLALIFLFYKTGSGNGILAFILGSIITYSFFTSRQFVIIKALCIFSVILFLAIYFKDYIFVRESHQKILTNIFDLSYQDDLVKLPIYAWLANLQYVVLGWGYGLIHYFSLEFLPLADWFELRYGYIDSNIGLISFISNFGVTGLMIFCYAFVKAKKVNRSFDMFVLLLTSYITIFVGASHTYPSYLIMGYIFSVSRSLADLGSNDKGI